MMSKTFLCLIFITALCFATISGAAELVMPKPGSVITANHLENSQNCVEFEWEQDSNVEERYFWLGTYEAIVNKKGLPFFEYHSGVNQPVPAPTKVNACNLPTLGDSIPIYGVWWEKNYSGEGWSVSTASFILRDSIFPEITHPKPFTKGEGLDGLWSIRHFGCDRGHDHDFNLMRDGAPVCGTENCPQEPGACWSAPNIEKTHAEHKLQWEPDQAGNVFLSIGKDIQVHGETHIFVEADEEIFYVPRHGETCAVWVNEEMRKGVTINNDIDAIELEHGWNHLEFTCYNQHEDVVKFNSIIASQIRPENSVARFAWTPGDVEGYQNRRGAGNYSLGISCSPEDLQCLDGHDSPSCVNVYEDIAQTSCAVDEQFLNCEDGLAYVRLWGIKGGHPSFREYVYKSPDQEGIMPSQNGYAWSCM